MDGGALHQGVMGDKKVPVIDKSEILYPECLTKTLDE